MNKQKIAIITDSCGDVPAAYVKQYGIYVLPLNINYKDRSYIDGVDITPDEILENFKTEVPSTSLPSGDQILDTFEKIKAEGFEKVLAIIISSGLSGTFNFVSMMAAEFTGLDFHVVDTKNIAAGTGIQAITAAQDIQNGMDWETLKKKADAGVSQSKLFFGVATLEYLRKGGRIGLVSAMLGDGLNLKPIITCNDEGIYHTIAKALGRKRSLARIVDEAVAYAKGCAKYNLALVQAGAAEEAAELKKIIEAKLPNFDMFIEGHISPALMVHTGPGALGLIVQKLV